MKKRGSSVDGQQPRITGLPVTLDRLNPDFTGFNTVGGVVFENLYQYRNPSGEIWAFEEGTPYFVDVFSVVPAQILVGTVGFFIQDPGQVKTVELWRQPLSIFNDYSDVRLRPSYPKGFMMKPGEFLQVRIISAIAAINANGDTTINGTQVSANMV